MGNLVQELTFISPEQENHCLELQCIYNVYINPRQITWVSEEKEPGKSLMHTYNITIILNES